MQSTHDALWLHPMIGSICRSLSEHAMRRLQHSIIKWNRFVLFSFHFKPISAVHRSINTVLELHTRTTIYPIVLRHFFVFRGKFFFFYQWLRTSTEMPIFLLFVAVFRNEAKEKRNVPFTILQFKSHIHARSTFQIEKLK